MSELQGRQDLQREEEVHPDQALSLGEIFGEKLMDFGSMGNLTRWVTGLGIAQIIAGVLLIWFNLFDLPKVIMGTGDSAPAIAVPIIVACVVFMIMAWTWLFVGALHARLLIRIPILSLFFLLQLQLVRTHGRTVTGWVVLLLALAYVLWHWRAKPVGYVRDLVVAGLGQSFFYLALLDQYRITNPSGQFVAMLVSMQVMSLAILLMPLLMLAGLDLGESVRDVARWVIGRGAARVGAGPLLWTAIALCAIKLIWFVAVGGYSAGWIGGLLFLVAAGYAFVRLKPWLGLLEEPPFGLLFLGSIIVMGLMVGGATLLFLAHQSPERAALWMYAVATLAALVAAVVAGAGGRVRSAAGRSVQAFLILFALWTLTQFLGAPEVTGGRWAVGLDSLDGVVAVLLPALLIYWWRRGLAMRSLSAWAISLTVGFSVIRAMLWAVQNNVDVPATAAAAQLVVMAIGLLWDVVTSGDKWTNGHSDHLPRTARILLYFGYVALTVTAILFFKASGYSESFDSDMFATVGLVVLGIPVYLYGFLRAGIMLARQAQVRQAP